ncbi:unnamed protein product [Rangifer tarandus platyrhynchus]|uniref:Uncharacterized protein n=2 Tax=Rangifer tarandus platyrhynchus TaxID=3082113 RepID=A0ACB0F4C2_RANTA|nr:unnamed protein product [Rangifer tarandus platyrhynchus]CAI9706956.1 unnamed protein product [Rangifer tarandus platyrhynchus]
MNNQVLLNFLLCGGLLVIKMYVVAIITGQVRLQKRVRAALGDPQSIVCTLTSPAAIGKAGFGDQKSSRPWSMWKRVGKDFPLPALWDGSSVARTSLSRGCFCFNPNLHVLLAQGPCSEPPGKSKR